MGWTQKFEAASRVGALTVASSTTLILVLEVLGLAPAQLGPFGPFSTAPATAFALLLLGCALLLRTRRVARSSALADLFAVGGGVVVFAGMVAPRFGLIRPAYNTAVAIALLAGAVIMLDRPVRGRAVFQWLVLGATLIAALATAGYVYGAPGLYHAVERTWGMALITALEILALGGAVLCARPTQGIVAPLVAYDVRGRALRRILPGVLGIPVFALALQLLARAESDVLPTVSAALAVAGMGGAIALAYALGRMLNREAVLEARLASLFASSSDPIVDTATDGTVLRWNAAAERVYGYTAADTVGRSIALVVPPESRAALERLRTEVLEHLESRVYEGERLRQDGSRFFGSTTLSPIFDQDCRVVGISAITHDLTERIRAERVLAEAARREAVERAWLESVIDQLPDVVVLRDADGRVRHMNRAALALEPAASSRAELEGTVPVFELRRPRGEVIPLDELPLMRALRHGETVRGEEATVRDAAGRDVPMLVGAAPVLDPSGKIVGATLVCHDITAQKQLAKLREEWTSLVAHDLRQPVSVIRLTADRLSKLCNADADTHQQIERIRVASKNLQRMIGDLLDVSQLDSQRLKLEPRPVELGELVGNVVSDFEDVVAPHRVELHEQDTPLAVAVDPGRIGQVLGNLLSNAAKYSTPDSEIVVDVHRCDGSAEVSVQNRGCGIPPDELTRLFARFSRSATTRGSGIPGLGLGLYITRGLVEAHGGRIWAESVPGETTTFHFTVPLTPAAPPH